MKTTYISILLVSNFVSLILLFTYYCGFNRQRAEISYLERQVNILHVAHCGYHWPDFNSNVPYPIPPRPGSGCQDH